MLAVSIELQQKQFRAEQRRDSVVTAGLIFGSVAAVAIVAWYLFLGPGLMNLMPSHHVFMIQAIAAIPSPEAHDILKSTLEQQGYVSAYQVSEILDVALSETEKLSANVN